MTTFVLWSASPFLPASALEAIAAACEPALADVARAWSPVYSELAAPRVRLAAVADDFATGEFPVLAVTDLGKGNERDLAFHWIKNGLPFGLVLATADQTPPSMQQSFWHELAEGLVDPDCSRYLNGKAAEVEDPLQGVDVPGLGGVNLSPTIFPAWFGIGTGPLDSAGIFTAAGQVDPTGYAMMEDGSEIHGDGYRHATGKLHPGSRRMRRRAKMGLAT